MNAYYQAYFPLPWGPSETDRRRSRRIVAAVLGLCIGFGIVVPLLPLPPRTIVQAPPAPERIVRYLLERPRPQPKVEQPPPAPVVLPEPEKPIEVSPATPAIELKPEARVQPTAPPAGNVPAARPDARRKAAASGLIALSDQLAELRDLDVDSRVQSQPLSAGVGGSTGTDPGVDRALLTSRAGAGSGGIAVAKASSGFGGGSTGLKGHATAQVASATGAAPATEARRSGSSSKGSRTREEVELVFDGNKSAIYALYSRALRDNPALQGKVVLEVSIAPSGEVTECRIVSSELGDPELERKLIARVKMFRFEAKDVAPMTTTKPIEFFPA